MIKIKPDIDILSYVKVIVIALVSAILVSGVLIYFAQLDVINHSSSRYNEKILRDYIKNTVILQNEDLEMQYPDDYRIDIHLGYLNQVIEDYAKAEDYYKKAIEKAPYNCYRPYFELAKLYVTMGRYDDSEEVMDDVPDKANIALIKYKSEIFRLLGDGYFNTGKYDFAIDKYNRSLYYQDKLEKPQKKVIAQINSQIFICNLNLADIYVNSDKIPEAVKHLKAAENYDPNSFNVRYKMAVANANYDPETSYKYFKALFDEDPTKVDYRAYYKVINLLSELYYEEGDTVKSDLYAFKAKQLLDYVASNVIYYNDLIFKVTDKKLYSINRRSKTLLTLRIQNCSNIPIRSLNVTVTYRLGKKVLEEYTKKIIDKNNILAAGDTIPDITLIPQKFTLIKDKDIPKITAEIYLYKSSTNKICVFNGQVFDNVKKR